MADKMSKLVLPVKTGNTIAPKEFDVGGGGNTFVGTTAEWEALTAEQQNAYDCRVLTDDELPVVEVIDNLTSDSSTDALSAKQGKVLAQLVAPVLSTLVAPAGGLASGDQFIYNGLLYKATAAIAAGGTIMINGNCALADSVTEQINGLNSNLTAEIVNMTDSLTLIRYGKFRLLITTNSTNTANVALLYTLPNTADFPSRRVYGAVNTSSTNPTHNRLSVNTNGEIYISDNNGYALSEVVIIYGQIAWFV